MKYKLIINSNIRPSAYPSASAFVWFLNKQISNIRQYNLADYYIPNSSYNVNDYNKTIYINYGGTNYIVNMTPSNYNTTQLCTHITTLLNSNVANVFTVSYNTQTNKITFTSTGFTFNLTFTSYNKATAKLLGFTQGTTTTALSITSPNVANLAITPLYYLKIDEFPSNNIKYGVDTTFVLNNNVNQLSYSDAMDAELLNNITILQNSFNLSQLTLKLYDINDNLVDLNGLDFVLEIDVYTD